MRITGYHISNGTIANSDGEVQRESPYLDFLLEDKPDTIKVLYHMSYNVAQLLKMTNFTEEEGKKLQSYDKVNIPPYLVRHAAGKFLSLKKGFYRHSPFAIFSDANQYKATELAGDGSVDDCLAKARVAQEIGQEVYDALCSIGLSPITLTSPIRAYEREVLSRMKLPTVDDIPEEAGLYAYNCCKGNWLEAFQLGHWEQSWSYDINSSYPAEIAQLLDLRQGEWERSSQVVDKAAYGYCKGKVTIDAPISPIMCKKEGANLVGLNYTPVGTWETYLTKKQIDFIYKWKIGSFELEDGWWWVPTREERIFKTVIEQLYLQKEQAVGVRREVIKRIMAGIWGKLLQTQRKEFGELFNPVYGAEGEVNTQLRVAEFIYENRVNPMHIAADGVIATEPVVLEKNGTRMGGWRLNSVAPCIVAGTAIATVQGGEKTSDFSLDYDWLMERIRQEPEASEYRMSKMSPVTLAVALNEKKWDKLGELREVVRSVEIGKEQKRCYKVQPKCGRELLGRQYGSEPWDISMVSSQTKKEVAKNE